MVFSWEHKCWLVSWDLHTGCVILEPLALHKAKNSKCEQRVLRVVILVGKLKARARQAVHFFLRLLLSGFRLVLAGGQVTSAT